jgi:tyrosyl-tRNA synthetase
VGLRALVPSSTGVRLLTSEDGPGSIWWPASLGIGHGDTRSGPSSGAPQTGATDAGRTTGVWQSRGMPALSEDLAFRGLIHQMTDPDLPKRIDQPGLTVYAGFDPSANSLHVGNLLQLCTLRRFQDAGHRPISLAGGGTGMIGDPGGKQDERQLLDLESIERYLEGIRPQLAQFLDLDGGRALLLNNADWLSRLSTLEYLRDVGKHFTINQMVAKESVRSRFERPDQGISYTEFSYMLLQAYDFLRLHVDYGCDLQFGGSDQWGNITLGVDYIRRTTGDEVWGFTTPLIVKPDGTKYGKTESGTVWLDPKRTSPFAMYQFFLNTPDEQVGVLLRYLTFLDHGEILALDADTAEHPQRRSAQRSLARAVVALVHGESEVVKCEEASAALFGEEIAGLSEEMLLAVTEDAPTTGVPRAELLDGLTLVDVFERTGLATSKKEARRTIEGGGAYVNNVRQTDTSRSLGRADLLHDRYVVLRKGPRGVHIVRAT